MDNSNYNIRLFKSLTDSIDKKTGELNILKGEIKEKEEILSELKEMEKEGRDLSAHWSELQKKITSKINWETPVIGCQ